MPNNMFMKFEGPELKGESMVEGHKDEIDIESASWGMSNLPSGHVGGGSGTAEAHVHDMNLTKYVDRASTTLAQKCLSGEHFSKATLTFRKVGGDDKPLDFLVVVMEQVFVTSVQTGGHAGSQPVESFSLNFAKVRATYNQQTAKGIGAGGIELTWNVAEHHK